MSELDRGQASHRHLHTVPPKNFNDGGRLDLLEPWGEEHQSFTYAQIRATLLIISIRFSFYDGGYLTWKTLIAFWWLWHILSHSVHPNPHSLLIWTWYDDFNSVVLFITNETVQFKAINRGNFQKHRYSSFIRILEVSRGGSPINNHTNPDWVRNYGGWREGGISVTKALYKQLTSRSAPLFW